MRELKLTKGLVTLVDDDDYEWLSKNGWYASYSGASHYARRYKQGKRVFMHREIMNPPADMFVDHINGNTLDNRRENLRVCTEKENIRNRRVRKDCGSGYKGVKWYKPRGKWLAKIIVDRVEKHVGYFTTPEEAARAYDRAAIEYFGEFAKTNF